MYRVLVDPGFHDFVCDHWHFYGQQVVINVGKKLILHCSTKKTVSIWGKKLTRFKPMLILQMSIISML